MSLSSSNQVVAKRFQYQAPEQPAQPAQPLKLLDFSDDILDYILLQIFNSANSTLFQRFRALKTIPFTCKRLKQLIYRKDTIFQPLAEKLVFPSKSAFVKTASHFDVVAFYSSVPRMMKRSKMPEPLSLNISQSRILESIRSAENYEGTHRIVFVSHELSDSRTCFQDRTNSVYIYDHTTNLVTQLPNTLTGIRAYNCIEKEGLLILEFPRCIRIYIQNKIDKGNYAYIFSRHINTATSNSALSKSFLISAKNQENKNITQIVSLFPYRDAGLILKSSYLHDGTKNRAEIPLNSIYPPWRDRLNEVTAINVINKSDRNATPIVCLAGPRYITVIELDPTATKITKRSTFLHKLPLITDGAEETIQSIDCNNDNYLLLTTTRRDKIFFYRYDIDDVRNNKLIATTQINLEFPGNQINSMAIQANGNTCIVAFSRLNNASNNTNSWIQIFNITPKGLIPRTKPLFFRPLGTLHNLKPKILQTANSDGAAQAAPQVNVSNEVLSVIHRDHGIINDVWEIRLNYIQGPLQPISP